MVQLKLAIRKIRNTSINIFPLKGKDCEVNCQAAINIFNTYYNDISIFNKSWHI